MPRSTAMMSFRVVEAADTPTPGPSAACWEFDISAVRALIESLPGGEPIERELAEQLMAGIRVHDVNAVAAYLVGPFGGHSAMIGEAVGRFWPTESHAVLTELVVALVNDRPLHRPRSHAITSLMLSDAGLTVQFKPDAPDIVDVAVRGVVHDHRSRWSLRSSEERYRRLIHHLPYALVQVDATPMDPIFAALRREGVTDIAAYLAATPALALQARKIVMVTGANRDAVKLFAAPDTEALIGPIGYMFAASPTTPHRLIIAHFEGRRSYSELMKLRRFDGELRDVQLSATFPAAPERLDVTLLSFEDVTDRLGTEAQLRRLQADHARAARISTLGELATSIAHEVSQPLSAIVTNAETSLRWLSRDDPNLPKIEQLTRRIADSAHRAHEIVQRIRAMAVRHAPERVPIDINEVIDEALLFTRHDIESRSITLLVEREPCLPLLGDKVQMQQVIVNLLLNSIQAIVQAGQKGRIELRTRAEGDEAFVISIRDNGPGIAPENLDRVFEGFFTTKDDGIGIGLAICQSLIIAHGGSISASNHPDGGACFQFSLPVAGET